MVLDSSKKIVAYYIICDKPSEISKGILTYYHRGVTRLDATGMFTGNEKSILLCLVPYDQSYKMREFVLAIDSKAFVFSTPVTQTIGENNLMSAPLPDINIKEKIKEIENITTPTADTTQLLPEIIEVKKVSPKKVAQKPTTPKAKQVKPKGEGMAKAKGKKVATIGSEAVKPKATTSTKKTPTKTNTQKKTTKTKNAE